MSDRNENLGKKYSGQKFAAVTSTEALAKDLAAQAKFDKPEAVGLDAYFAIKGIRNPVMQAGMLAYTKIRRATVTDWDAIFSTY